MSRLTAEYVRALINYDPDTGVLVWKRRPEKNRIDKMWNTRFASKTISHKNSTGHIQFGINGHNYLGHRIAWLLVHGEWPEQCIDHINGIRDDNRICNLREATRSQNNSNTKRYANNTNGFRGVWKNGYRWCASIRADSRQRYLGTFGCPTAAAFAYDRAAKELHGEFATLNFGGL